MNAPWLRVTESKVSWFLLGGKSKSKPKSTDKDHKPCWIKMGVRINMADGSWWFFHYKYGSWKKHWTRVQATNRLGQPAFDGDKPIMLPERTESYKDQATLEKEWTRMPELVSALLTAVHIAELEEAAKKAA